MPNYDAIRLAAIVAIVLLHTAANGVNRLPFDSSSWWLANVIDSTCRAGVPLFLMLSGALFLNRPQLDSRQFYRRRFQRLAIPLLCWSLFYLGWSAAKASYKGEHYSLMQAMTQLSGGAPYYHLWFIYMLVGIYAALPLLRRYWLSLSGPQQLRLTVASLLLQQSLHLASFVLPVSFAAMTPAWLSAEIPWPLWFVGYLPYLLLGAVLSRSQPALSRRWQLLLLLAFASISLLIAWLYFQQRELLTPEPFYYAYHRMSLPVLLAAILLWQLLSPSNWRPGAVGKKIVQHSLAIYCMHPLLLDVTTLAFAGNNTLPYGALLILQASLVLTGSLLMRLLREQARLLMAHQR